MKKIISSVFVIIVLFGIVGCGSNKEYKNDIENVPEKKEEVIDESLVKINNLEFHLDKETSFKDIKYTIVKDFKEANYDRYIQYNYYQEDNSNLLFFRIFYYSKKTNKEIIKDLGLDDKIELKDGKTDNVEYKFYDEPRDDGGTIHFYFINKNEKTYVLNFMSKYDIKDFEEKVLKSVKF